MSNLTDVVFCLQLTDDELTIEDKAKKGRIALTKAKIFGGVDETAAQKKTHGPMKDRTQKAKDVMLGGANGYRSGNRQDTKHPGLPALVVPEGCACPKCTSKFTRAMAATIRINHNKKHGTTNWQCVDLVSQMPPSVLHQEKKSLNLIFDGQLENLHDFQENMEKRGKLEMAAYKKALPAE